MKKMTLFIKWLIYYALSRLFLKITVRVASYEKPFFFISKITGVLLRKAVLSKLAYKCLTRIED